MIQSTKPSVRAQIKAMKASFLQTTDTPFSDLLPPDWFERLTAQAGDYRAQLFTPIVTLQMFLRQVLSADGSCQEAVWGLWASQVEKQAEPPSANTGPYCKARQRLPLALLKEAVQISGETLHNAAPTQWQWHGYNVKLVDGTTVLMPDSEANQNAYPQPRSQKPGLGFPLARLVGLFSLSSGAVVDYALGRYRGKKTGELSLLAQQLDSLKSGDLLLGDRYFCTYGLIAEQQRRGVPVVFQSHAKRAIDFRRGRRLGVKDHIIEWRKPACKPVWMSASDYHALPPTLRVREVAVGRHVYVTTLYSAAAFSKKAIAQLYAQRWIVEVDLRTLKTDLTMEKLRCQSPEMVRKEIAVHFLAYNFIRSAIAQAALFHQVLPRTLSFKATVQLLNQMKTQLLNLSTQAVLALWKAIASTHIGQRQRTPQPRAVKQRPKPYPRLAVPRKVACQQLVAEFN